MNRILQGLVSVAIMGLAVPAVAETGCAICDNVANSDNHGVKTGCQLARGVANVGGCWLELVNQPMKEVKNGGNVLVGVGKGIGHTGWRAVKGGAEIVTAPLPRAKDGDQIATDCPICMWRA